MYFEIIDQTIVSLNNRFESKTMKLLNNFENFVTGSDNINAQEITKFYNTGSNEIELDSRRLTNERDLILEVINKDESFKKKLKDLRKGKPLKKYKL